MVLIKKAQIINSPKNTFVSEGKGYKGCEKLNISSYSGKQLLATLLDQCQTRPSENWCTKRRPYDSSRKYSGVAKIEM